MESGVSSRAVANAPVIGTETLWGMGLAYMATHNGHLVIPAKFTVGLSEKDVNDLKVRFRYE